MDSLDEPCLSSVRRKRLENLYIKRQRFRQLPTFFINRICPLSNWPYNAPVIVARDPKRFEVHEIRQQPYLEVQELEKGLSNRLLSSAHGLLSRIHQLNSTMRKRYCGRYHYGLPGFGHHQ